MEPISSTSKQGSPTITRVYIRFKVSVFMPCTTRRYKSTDCTHHTIAVAVNVKTLKKLDKAHTLNPSEASNGTALLAHRSELGIEPTAVNETDESKDKNANDITSICLRLVSSMSQIVSTMEQVTMLSKDM
jgi:hypothetical protein